jgi:hypothetical protein
VCGFENTWQYSIALGRVGVCTAVQCIGQVKKGPFHELLKGDDVFPKEIISGQRTIFGIASRKGS